jgi:hypothetical protein
MIKLIAAESKAGYQLALSFSDGSAGVFDFKPFVDTDTPMTAPLRDSAFLAQHCIEQGALAWPNGLDFSAESLRRRLQDVGKLVRG